MLFGTVKGYSGPDFFLLAQSHDPALPEDLTQETFYQAVRSIGSFNGSCKISVWLCQIAKHLLYLFRDNGGDEAVIRHIKGGVPALHPFRGHGLLVPEGADFGGIPQFDGEIPSSSAEESLLEKEGRMDLLRQIHSLSQDAREVMYLRAFGKWYTVRACCR